MSLPWLAPSPVQVWAVEPGAAQLTWGHLPRGQLTVEIANRQPISAVHEGGPGSLILENLQPGQTEIHLRWIGGVTRLSTTIPPAPPGQELMRIATVSDLHLGSRNWGALRTITDIETDDDDHYDMRCATAAINEAIDWGASLLIIKGDAAHHRRDRDFQLVGELVDRFPRLPMVMIPGNHDMDDAWPIPVPKTFGRRGLPLETGVVSHDFEGVRMIAGNTTVEHKRHGTIEPIAEEILDLAAESPVQNLLALHHQFQTLPMVTYWPPGISSAEANPFLDKLVRAAPRTFVTSGHTHRNRSRRSGPLVLTEVGATKDWPGTWGGYRIFEGGIYQTVRRIAASESISWTEYSRRALLGLWSPWSPGEISDRCIGL